MTDKQIIKVDSLDELYITQLQAQLKHKEQECEQLRGELWVVEENLKDYIEHYNRQCEQLDQLKAELEQEKALKETYLACYKAKHKDIEGKLFKLKQTLQEIKKIAEKIDDSGGCDYGDYDCDNCSSLEQEIVCTYKVKKLILQKISEVNNDR